MNWPCCHRFAAALGMTCALSSCYPSQLPDPEPFREDRVAFVQIGVTSSEEIAAAMSDFPVRVDSQEVRRSLKPKKYRNGTTWLYGQRREKLVVDVLGSPNVYTSDFGGFDYRFWLINFDTNGVVESFETLESEGGCSRDGVCVRETADHDLEYWLLATEAEDQLVKQSKIAPDLCGVFLFGKTRGRRGTLAIVLDDRDIGEVMDDRHYYFVTVSKGNHRLLLSRPFYISDYILSGKQPTLHDFNCAGGERFFFDMRPRSGEVEVTEVEESAGRAALASRRLTLNED